MYLLNLQTLPFSVAWKSSTCNLPSTIIFLLRQVRRLSPILATMIFWSAWSRCDVVRLTLWGLVLSPEFDTCLTRPRTGWVSAKFSVVYFDFGWQKIPRLSFAVILNLLLEWILSSDDKDLDVALSSNFYIVRIWSFCGSSSSFSRYLVCIVEGLLKITMANPVLHALCFRKPEASREGCTISLAQWTDGYKILPRCWRSVCNGRWTIMLLFPLRWTFATTMPFCSIASLPTKCERIVSLLESRTRKVLNKWALASQFEYGCAGKGNGGR